MIVVLQWIADIMSCHHDVARVGVLQASQLLLGRVRLVRGFSLLNMANAILIL